MTVGPDRLNGIAANSNKAHQAKGISGKRPLWTPIHIPEDVHLSFAPGARTRPSEFLQPNERLSAVIPPDRQFLTDLLNVCRSHAQKLTDLRCHSPTWVSKGGIPQFRDALSAIVEFCNVDLSAFYLDVRKDALYCDAPNSLRRRACRTALDEVFSRLTVWLAPILPFTMEEVWLTRFPNEKSVHLRRFPETPAAWEDAFAGEEMARLREARRSQAKPRAD